mmetsp:Transcript_3939/g.13971  ORF Transcript_3939/g.13971 Transcript_3939/m.13971 type:complete len:116 (-) Transcript_3939:1372-1719(-)
MTNPFELLGQDENEDPQDLAAAAASKAEERQAEAAKKDSKANSQAAAKPARTQRNDRGGGRGGRAGGDRPSYSGDDDVCLSVCCAYFHLGLGSGGLVQNCMWNLTFWFGFPAHLS